MDALAVFAIFHLGGIGLPLLFAILVAPAAVLGLRHARRYLLLKNAAANMWQGLVVYNARGELVLYNGRFCAMLGLSPDDVRGAKTHRDIINLSFEAGNYARSSAEQVLREDADFIARRKAALAYIDLPGNRTVAESHEPTGDGGWIRTYADVTGRRQIEERIVHMAHHDGLTDLPNRSLFRKRLEQALKEASEARPLALMFLDLDRFKSVNDTLGHAVGDQLLMRVADRLRRAVRENDTVARLGGDEFAIVQSGIGGARQARELAERLVESIGAVYEIDGVPVSIGVSVGVTLSPADGTETEKLLRNADLALYRAKSIGRGAHCFFVAGMEARMMRRQILEADLRQAMQCEQFELLYQPVVCLKSFEIVSFEALLRWPHPVHGVISPDEFIPIAEETGLIIDLGAWMLQEACRTAANWPEHIRLAVNGSPVQFRGEQLVGDVVEALSRSGLEGRRLEIEVTEALMLEENGATLSALHQLSALGVGISMDDFGTGRSSLGSLSRFPFQTVKIDRSFIKDIVTRPESLAIARAVTQLGLGLGMRVTAEGIETREQLAELTAQGCALGQGYLFGHPMPESSIGDYLDRWDATAFSDLNYA